MGFVGDIGNNQQQALAWGAAFLLGISFGRLVGQWRGRRRDPKLHGAVANASKVSAAWRAVESLELEGKLFSDELAVILAGQKYFAQALAAAQPYVRTDDGQPGRRLYKVSELAARTWWFDRAILTALTSPAVPATKGWLSARLSSSARGPSSPPHQLVLIGSGMDTRAWRLPLPPGLKCFEIDRAEVLGAKKRALSRAGAEIPKEGGAPQYPLRCDSWAGVAADVSKDDFIASLVNEGFDPQAPTVWVLEGVLMFLEGADVEKLLKAVLEASAQGSSIIGHALTDAGLEALKGAGNNSLQPTARQVGGGGNQTSGAGAASPVAVFYSVGVSKACKSSLPRDPADVLESYGWVQQSVVTLPEIGNQICGGAPAGKCDFEVLLSPTGGRNVAVAESTRREEVFFCAKKQ